MGLWTDWGKKGAAGPIKVSSDQSRLGLREHGQLLLALRLRKRLGKINCACPLPSRLLLLLLSP